MLGNIWTPKKPPQRTRKQLDDMKDWTAPDIDLSGGRAKELEGLLKEYIVAALKQSNTKKDIH